MEFKFKLSEEESINAKRLGLPTEYEVKPHAYSERVEVWYCEDGEDRYALYDKRIVEDKLNRGIWIKIESNSAIEERMDILLSSLTNEERTVLAEKLNGEGNA